MKKEYTLVAAILGLSFIGGLAVAAFRLADSLDDYRKAQRSVQVKGLAERSVPADIAVWPIQLQNASNDLSDLEKKIQSDRKAVRDFLVAAGFPATEISTNPPKITDVEANQYSSPQGKRFRYLAQTTISLRTTNIEQLKETLQRSNQLIKQGVVLAAAGYGDEVQYFFTGLNEIKPAMIEEATKNARLAAQQFAKDSDSRVGNIKHASQGLFTIRDQDPYSPDIKIVRVVSSLTFFLE